MKALSSTVLVLSATLLVLSPSFGQTVIEGNTISEADLPAVQAACDDLALAADNSSITTGSDDADKEAEDGTVTSIDLSMLTVDNCRAAGLID